MTATYFRHGEGRSIAARAAESNGRMPLSRAKIAVARRFACTQTVAVEALELLHDGEWHHVGKFAAECKYYNADDDRLGGVIHHILANGGPMKFRRNCDALRRARRAAKIFNLSRQFSRGLDGFAKRRRENRRIAGEALGRDLAGVAYPTGLNEQFCTFHDGDAFCTIAVRKAGWSDELIALVLADRGYTVGDIRRLMTYTAGDLKAILEERR